MSEQNKIEESKTYEKDNKQNKQGGDDKPERKQYDKKPRNDPSKPIKELFGGADLKKPKREYDQYLKKPKFEREEWGKIEVTLETEIPELPKKNKKIQKPDEEAVLKQLEKANDQIDIHYEKIQKFIEELRAQVQKNKSQGKTNQDPLRDIVKSKGEQKKALYDVFNSIKEKYDVVKCQLEECQNQSATYKQKMKNYRNKAEIVSELNFLKDQQQQGSISIQEEKVVIKKIAELQKALPYAEPLEGLAVQIKALKTQKDSQGLQLKDYGSKIKVLKDDINASFETINSIKLENDKVFQNYQPQIEQKRSEEFPKIEELKLHKKELKEAYYKQWEEYDKQEQLAKKIEFMKKRKAYLQRKHLEETEQQEADDKLKEELSQINENPYKEDINLCQLLLEYVLKLQPKQAQQVDEIKDKVDIQQALKTDEWKKEKVTEISFRKDEELNEFAIQGGKGKKGKKNNQKIQPQKQNDQPREVLLNHQIEILQYFEQISIPAPLLQKQLDETVKLLTDKKKYFEELPSDEVTGYLKPSNKEEEEQQQQQKQSQKKKEKQTFNVLDEEFPNML